MNGHTEILSVQHLRCRMYAETRRSHGRAIEGRLDEEGCECSFALSDKENEQVADVDDVERLCEILAAYAVRVPWCIPRMYASASDGVIGFAK